MFVINSSLSYYLLQTSSFWNNKDIHYSLPFILLLCKYLYNLFAQSSCTSCLYYYLLSLPYTVCTSYFIAHFYLYFFFFTSFFSPYQFLCIFSCVCIPYNCTVHGADLTYISLLVIFCIIVCVTNTNCES